MTANGANCRDLWRPVLDAEVKRWSTKSYQQLTAEPAGALAYKTVHDGKNYQVEVELLENTDNYAHVIVSVDDGSLPASLLPLSASFIQEKSTGGHLRPLDDQRPTTDDRGLL